MEEVPLENSARDGTFAIRYDRKKLARVLPETSVNKVPMLSEMPCSERCTVYFFPYSIFQTTRTRDDTRPRRVLIDTFLHAKRIDKKLSLSHL